MIQANIKSAVMDRRNFYIMASVMTVNNLLWFVIWMVFFDLVGEVGGWNVHDMARLFGITALSFGIALFCFGGAWHIARAISSGHLDVHLARPKPALVSLVLSRSEPEAIGDVIAGLIFFFWMGNMGWPGTMGAIALSVCGASIFVSTAIIFNSLIFWTKGRTGMIDQLVEVFLNISSMPLHGLPTAIKVVLFTVLPAGLIAFLPTDILRDFSWFKVLAMLVATVGLPLLAVYIFNRGLRRYSSGNKMLEVR